MGYVGNVEDELKSFSPSYDAVSVSTDVNHFNHKSKRRLLHNANTIHKMLIFGLRIQTDVPL